MKITVSNIRAGQVVSAGYRSTRYDSMDANRFVGFKVGDIYFSKLKDLKEFYGVNNLQALESATSPLKVSVTAEFQNVSEEDPYFWAAYLYNGSFKVGTSADRLTLSSAS